ncbi:AAA family ATPase [Psychrobacter sp. I-STPA10]|uniref:AAA family ATPase n=1 Tax=Psychrobacter sp. I-STPA10 TaxID=2585769 RepID=UPI001E3534B1|nr:AAA family ATPase [Psychrobacter sp. I-STPA10]
MTLQQILQAHGISQRKLAAETNYSPAVINQLIKHGKYPSSIAPETIHNNIDNALTALNVTSMPNWQAMQATQITNNNPLAQKELPDMQALTQAAKQLFKLHKSPFADDVQSREDVYLSAEQRYIRQSMLSTAKHGGFIAIIGESGAGKTTLKRDLIEGVKEDKDSVIIIQPQAIDKTRLSVAHLCDAIIDDISRGQENPKRSMEAKARQIKRLLTDSSRAGNKHCLVIDEAHDLTIPMLKYLKRFWELEDGMRRLLAIVLIGQPELKIKLNERNSDIREVARRCEQVELQPLNAYVGDYLKHKCQRASLSFDAIFADDAMSGLTARLTQTNGEHSISLLYPLIVNNAVIAAMNKCAEIGQSKITADIFEGI